jgi:hypothetical protein
METEIIKDAEAAASTPPQDEDIEIKSKIKCEKCGRSMAEDKFYTKRNGEKFTLCKNCLTLHVDNADPKTFTWILEEADVPYVPSKWNSLYDRAFARNPYKLTGTSVLGKYLSSMKLNNFKDKGWADSEELIAEIESRERVD